MTTLDRNDWVTSPYTKELIEHLVAGRNEIATSMGDGMCAGDSVDITAMSYANNIGKINMLHLTLDYIEHGLVEEESEEDGEETPGNTAESYDDED